MLSKDMKRAENRPDWVDLVPAERTLLERLRPRRSTLRSDRRPGNRAASPRRSSVPHRVSGNGTLVQCTETCSPRRRGGGERFGRLRSSGRVSD